MKPFDNYEISPCRRFDEDGLPAPRTGLTYEVCEPHEADLWTLYGHIPGEGVMAIGDFDSRVHAEEAFQRITGMPFGSHEEVEARVRVMHAGPRLLEALRGLLDQLKAIGIPDWHGAEGLSLEKSFSAVAEAESAAAKIESVPLKEPIWQSEAERVAGLGWIVNVGATPHGCCASIVSHAKPYETYRCQNAASLEAAFESCRMQMDEAKAGAEGRAA